MPSAARSIFFPGQVYVEERLAFVTAIAGRNAGLGRMDYTLSAGPRGGVNIAFAVELTAALADPQGRGHLISRDVGDLPTLYDRGGTVLRDRLDVLAMYYGNRNAWYGQPGPMLNGNPLVQGTPAGAGTSGRAEGFVHDGLYGITPLADAAYLYGGLSAVTSASSGQEIFTDADRSHTAIEDAFAGMTGDAGNWLVSNLSAGRQ